MFALFSLSTIETVGLAVGAIASVVSIAVGVVTLRNSHRASKAVFEPVELEVEFRSSKNGPFWIAIRIQNLTDQRILIKKCALRAYSKGRVSDMMARQLDSTNRKEEPIGDNYIEDVLLEQGDFISCYVDCDFSSAHLVQDQIRSAKSIREALKLLSKISVPQDREIVVETPRGDVAYDFHADDVELRSQSAESYLQENWESMKADD